MNFLVMESTDRDSRKAMLTSVVFPWCVRKEMRATAVRSESKVQDTREKTDMSVVEMKPTGVTTVPVTVTVSEKTVAIDLTRELGEELLELIKSAPNPFHKRIGLSIVGHQNSKDLRTISLRVKNMVRCRGEEAPRMANPHWHRSGRCYIQFQRTGNLAVAALSGLENGSHNVDLRIDRRVPGDPLLEFTVPISQAPLLDVKEEVVQEAEVIHPSRRDPAGSGSGQGFFPTAVPEVGLRTPHGEHGHIQAVDEATAPSPPASPEAQEVAEPARTVEMLVVTPWGDIVCDVPEAEAKDLVRRYRRQGG